LEDLGHEIREVAGHEGLRLTGVTRIVYGREATYGRERIA
jgi:hypothetical protein